MPDTRYEPVTENDNRMGAGRNKISKSDSESLDDNVSYRSDVITSKLIQLLQNAKNRTMALQDLTDSLVGHITYLHCTVGQRTLCVAD
jgi:hypothetical protein